MIRSMEPDLTEDALLGGRVRLLQPRRGYRVAVDAVLLAAAIDAAAGQHVLDLGAGVGAVGLCLAARVHDCSVVGVEVQPALADLAERNAALNGMSARVRTIIHDLALPADLGKFDHVATNPPYLAAAVADPSPDPSKALATVESSADLARWLAVATGAAKSAGTVLIIQRSDRLEEIVAHLVRLGWGDVAIKRLPPAARVLIRARHGGTLQRIESPPLVLHRPEGGYTDAAEAVLRHAAPLAF
jgi:tRNA1(Val) A37 N6-methylase TrmN6